MSRHHPAVLFFSIRNCSIINVLTLTLRLFSPSSILCRFLFSANDTQIFQIRPNSKRALSRPLSPRSDKYPNTTADELLALVDQVRGHLTVTHELLEAQKVQAASPQAAEKASLLPAASAPSE